MADITIARVRVRWQSNKSPKYDGRVEDMSIDSISAEDRADLCVGKTIRVHWGLRVWTGEVLKVFEEPTPLAQALPLKRPRTTTQRLIIEPAFSVPPISSGIPIMYILVLSSFILRLYRYIAYV